VHLPQFSPFIIVRTPQIDEDGENGVLINNLFPFSFSSSSVVMVTT
jgi:hypothetical protein